MSSARRAQMRREMRAKSDNPTLVRSGGERDVAIVYTRPGHVDGAFADCLANLLLWDGKHHRRVETKIAAESGPRIAQARNDLVKAALANPQHQWVLMLDTDMTFTPDLLDRMLFSAETHRLPILGGLCFSGQPGGAILPTVYSTEIVDGRVMTNLELSYPKDCVFEVRATGAACLLVHRQVYEKVLAAWGNKSVHPWFQETQYPPDPATGFAGHSIGEDVTFCLRAVQLGYEIHIDSSIKVGHRKIGLLDEQSYLDCAEHYSNDGTQLELTQALAARTYGTET